MNWPPELVIEVDITSPSLDKLPLLASLGVLEVWRFDGIRVDIFRLSGDMYLKVHESTVLPGVSREAISRLLEASQSMKHPDWLQLVRESVRQ